MVMRWARPFGSLRSLGAAALGIAAAAGVFVFAGEAMALTADGSLMTNTATATFTTISGARYEVSYLATDTVLICNPLVAYYKTATPTMTQQSGTVVFTLCVVNSSITTSALNLTIVDKLPDYMSYVNPGYTEWPAGWQDSYAAAEVGPYTAGQPVNGSVNPLYLHWSIQVIGPRRSGCITYTGRVLP